MGIQYNVYKDHAVVAGYDSTQGTLVIPNTYCNKPVTEIAAAAFAENNVLQTVVLPDVLRRIGAKAFQNCTRLSAVLPNATYFSQKSASACSVVLPSLLQSVGRQAFRGCRQISNVSFRGLTSFESDAFADCGGIDLANMDAIAYNDTNRAYHL